ncbi:MAG: VOC family protein [Gemmatimonadaceae bacterium]
MNSDAAGHEVTIVSPVSRHLLVVDIERATAFYRDVLGFDVRPVHETYGAPAAAEVVRGAARIQLGEGGNAENLTPSAAIVFFETDDVSAMRDAIRARGGDVSDVQRVNWIKMEMFQVRDPDGHTLWFGKSFHEQYADMHTPAGSGQLRAALPELPLADVAAGVVYYRDVLGFKINYQQHDLSVMDRDSITLLLIAKTERHSGIGSCSFYVRDADALHAELTQRGANVQGTPVSYPWGLRQFYVLDPEGNRLSFSQTFE